jgi:peptide/nickel transport system ATP-binding protein
MATLLTVDDLSVQFGPRHQPVYALAGASFEIAAGEIVGIAGESGSGKSTLCSAIVRALPNGGRVSGNVTFEGRDLYALSSAEMRAVRGREIAMVLQNPMTSIDPLFTIGSQMGEVLQQRREVPSQRIPARSIDLLRRVHLTAPEVRVRQYPHQLSGGMKQRVLIAMAIASSPKLLIADEPTTALDATIQEEILLIFKEIRDAADTAIAIVTHDLGVIRRICDRVIIMYAGRIVEEGPTEDVFSRPLHPYTRGLLASTPRIENDLVQLQSIPGTVPNLNELGPGCAFFDRCSVAMDQCRSEMPLETRGGARHRLFCWQHGRLQ